MRRLYTGLAVAALVALIAVGCGRSRASDAKDTATTGALQGKLVITGSSTVAPLANEIARRFVEQHPDVQIDVQTGGSSRGVADAHAGLADIGMASRKLKASEAELTAHTIARDGICLIVHADNPLATLDADQVRAIWRGEITRWSQLGGQDAPITVVHKAEGRSTLELFLAYFALTNKETKPTVIIGDNEAGIKTVAGNPQAIGYVSIGAAEYSASQKVPIRLLPMAGVEPTAATVAAGTYPLSRPLNLVTREATPTGLAAAYIAFAQSAAVHDLVEDLYVVPLAP